MDLFVKTLGFPEAWPVGPFWPSALTSGIALGGVNLEFVQPLNNPPSEASIQTLVFEPTRLSDAIRWYEGMGVAMELREKWEGDPTLLHLRGFEAVDEPQLICRNLIPTQKPAFDFFLCEYSPFLKDRLSPDRFSVFTEVSRIELATTADIDIPEIEGLEMDIVSRSAETSEVTAIVFTNGPIQFGDWPARFRFI
ncbi:hypothetical protein BH11ARM1_BH11ARM1_10110 [soil metagenome]